ncbi:hypothetical protein Peetri_00025 [Pseudomonas phage vB_PpuM-Peetri]
MKQPVWVTLTGNTKMHNVPYQIDQRHVREWLHWGLKMYPIQFPPPPDTLVGTHSMSLKFWDMRKFYLWSVKCTCIYTGEVHHLGGGSWLTKSQAKVLQDDGIELGILLNTVPEWVVDMGLLKPWCFLQDLFAFRNPFPQREKNR